MKKLIYAAMIASAALVANASLVSTAAQAQSSCTTSNNGDEKCVGNNRLKCVCIGSSCSWTNWPGSC